MPSATSRWQWRSLWGGVAVVFAVLQLSSSFPGSEPSIHEAVAERLDQPLPGGATARQVVLSLAGSGGVVMANVGQATGFILQRPMVSLVNPQFSSIQWNEENVQATMRRFSVKVLVVHKIGQDAIVDSFPSPFIQRLASGNSTEWLHKVAESKAVVIYGANLAR